MAIDQNKQSPEASVRGVCHTEEECTHMYADLSPEKKQPALDMLAKELVTIKEEISKAYEADPEGWYIGYHFGWGMATRNLLRNKGFGEEYFGVHNLDDIYVALVEEALGLNAQEPGKRLLTLPTLPYMRPFAGVASPSILESKPPFWCRMGLHSYYFVKEVDVEDYRGPFDPIPNRTKKMNENICVRCGKTKLFEPYTFDDYPGL